MSEKPPIPIAWKKVLKGYGKTTQNFLFCLLAETAFTGQVLQSAAHSKSVWTVTYVRKSLARWTAWVAVSHKYFNISEKTKASSEVMYTQSQLIHPWHSRLSYIQMISSLEIPQDDTKVFSCSTSEWKQNIK